MMKLKIDKHIKIPRPRGRNSRYRELIADMEEGDSVGDLTQNEANGMQQLMSKQGIKAVSRKTSVGRTEDRVYRVWHDGRLEITSTPPNYDVGTLTNTVNITPGILQQAEAHEDKHNIVEDTREVFKKVNEELLAIKKKEKGE